MVVRNKNKRGRKNEKEGRGFGRLPSFFFSPFLFVFSRFFSSDDFGPNLVVFFVFWGFDYFRILEIFYYKRVPHKSTFSILCTQFNLHIFHSSEFYLLTYKIFTERHKRIFSLVETLINAQLLQFCWI